MTDDARRAFKRANWYSEFERLPPYGDTSPRARLFELRVAERAYSEQADGAHCAREIAEFARERLPVLRARIAALEAELAPPMRVVHGGTR